MGRSLGGHEMRVKVAALSASAVALVALVAHEGYKGEAYIPIPGDVPTIGFGTTQGVKMGDKIDPVKALERALADMQKFEGAIKECVKVPLKQNEYEAYLSLSYNIGSRAFCGSTLVKKLNQFDYAGACQEILRWDKAGGKVIRGLTIRRQKEYEQCTL
jgi:lysozyme